MVDLEHIGVDRRGPSRRPDGKVAAGELEERTRIVDDRCADAVFIEDLACADEGLIGGVIIRLARDRERDLDGLAVLVIPGVVLKGALTLIQEIPCLCKRIVKTVITGGRPCLDACVIKRIVDPARRREAAVDGSGERPGIVVLYIGGIEHRHQRTADIDVGNKLGVDPDIAVTGRLDGTVGEEGGRLDLIQVLLRGARVGDIDILTLQRRHHLRGLLHLILNVLDLRVVDLIGVSARCIVVIVADEIDDVVS